MKTLICEEPGRFAYAETELPKPSADEVILRVRRIGVCGTDLHAYEGTQPYFSYPRILGHELGCEIADPNGHADWKIGDPVTLIPYFHCGHCIACRTGQTNCCASLKVYGVHIDGGMRTHIAVPAALLVSGAGMSFDELALVEPLAIGAHGIRRANVQPGEFVLIVGAGPIGLGLMAFAHIAGAQVIALDINDTRLDFCRARLGVEHVIHGGREDVDARLKEITAGDMPTVVIDATGNRNAILQGFSYMSHAGRYVLVGLQKGEVAVSHPEFHKREGTLMSSRNATRADFDHVIDSMRRGLVDPATFISHRVEFEAAADSFPQWLNPATGVIKAMISL
jgi:2-desacetyl-2-hydroxyethyl bacteriochlorophyllide A dehydrogenase